MQSSPLNIHILALESRCEVRCNMPFQFPYVLLMFGLARPSTLRAPPVSREGVQYIIVKLLRHIFEKIMAGTRKYDIVTRVESDLYGHINHPIPGSRCHIPDTKRYLFESSLQYLYNDVLHALPRHWGRTQRTWTRKAEH